MQVESVHLNVPTPSVVKYKWWQKMKPDHRGWIQRNLGLQWLRDNFTPDNCDGIVYLTDDDNKYDLRLFREVK